MGKSFRYETTESVHRKEKLVTLVIFVLLIGNFGCNEKEYRMVPVDNPTYIKNTAFKYSEDLSDPKFQNLKAKYQLDTIFEGEQDEFKRSILIRNWIHTAIKIEDHGDPYPGDGYVDRILDAALEGTGFHCGHFTKVQNAILNGYGQVARTIGAGSGAADNDISDVHHAINEVWSNSYGKWYLSDAKYNHHFEKNGIPLSALEIRDEYLKNKVSDIDLVKGPKRVPLEYDSILHRGKENFARTYSWIEYHKNNNMFTAWPNFDSPLVMYADDYFNNHTWLWDGKPHWAYGNTEYMLLETDRNAIEWTPNTIASQIKIVDQEAHIDLTSDTPYLKEYQMKELPSGAWKKVESAVKIDLTDNVHEIIFRVVNMANVTGPEHRIKIVGE
ncbi:MAG: transglutaminase domain-containing protein [Saprospiraceae bacterium]|nr:transglutaminase domain-containing protein [Saprospiraceae bacterium]